MMVKSSSISQGMSPAQLAITLNDIATTAAQIRELARDVGMGAESSGQLAGAIQSLAERIGWMADLVSAGVPNGAVLLGGPEAWMMPPAYLGGTNGLC
jgi:hypothetical protein